MISTVTQYTKNEDIHIAYQVIAQLIEKHNGRVVDALGDNVLAVFKHIRQPGLQRRSGAAYVSFIPS